MKLSLKGHDFRYATEQMLFSLLPRESVTFEGGDEDNATCVTFSVGRQWATSHATVSYNGKTSTGMARVAAACLNGTLNYARYGQQTVKLALYRAVTRLLGAEPPWGALTGVRPVKLPTRSMQLGATPAQAKKTLTTLYRVSPPRAELAMACAHATLRARAGLIPGDISLYIGIPFCPSRCTYCSFISADVKGALALVEPYLEGLLTEIAAAGKLLSQNGLTVKSIYIGGGTPTTLSPQQITRLMAAVTQSIDLARCVEYTVEAGRPDTITREKLLAIAAGGGGRISVNPQSMDDNVLRAMGRCHSAQQCRDAYALARQVGGLAINMDLIAGLPGDSLAGFSASLDEVIALAPENITIHTLALKKGAALLTTRKDLPLPSGEMVEQMLALSQAALTRGGYRPYYLYRQKHMSGALENVGWCKRDWEGLYNICMMEELHSILSLGAGGITKVINQETGHLERIANPKYPKEYLDKLLQNVSRKEAVVWPISFPSSMPLSPPTP